MAELVAQLVPVTTVLGVRAIELTPHWQDAVAPLDGFMQQLEESAVMGRQAVKDGCGRTRVMEDRQWLRQHLGKMTERQESAHAAPWKMSDAPPQHIEALMGAIVGIEIPIAKLEGKWKVSQNRAPADRAGAVAGLRERGDEQSLEMAELITRHSGLPNS